MHGLKRFLLEAARRVWRRGRRRLDSDHGAIATILAVVLSGGILTGMGAVVIDVGALYLEREQLQTGADAASWKVALNCVASTTACTSATQTPIAVGYAKKNAKDGAADAQICLNNTGCPTWKTAITCPTVTTPNASYVEVRTTTVTSSGTTLLPPTFAQALAGSTYAGKRVGACGRVAWGTPVSAGSLALSVSLCDWTRMTSSGTVFYGLPAVSNLLSQIGLFGALGLTPVSGVADSPLVQNVPLVGSLPLCTTPLTIPATPRGYAWVGAKDSNCMINVTPPVTLNSFVPNILDGSATSCGNALKNARLTGQPVLVPIFDTVAGITSVLGSYHIIGFAPFVVTGYQNLFSGLGTTLSTLSGGLPSLSATLCGLGNCIYGYFTKALIPQARPVFGSTPSYGATVIGRTG